VTRPLPRSIGSVSRSRTVRALVALLVLVPLTGAHKPNLESRVLATTQRLELREKLAGEGAIPVVSSTTRFLPAWAGTYGGGLMGVELNVDRSFVLTLRGCMPPLHQEAGGVWEIEGELALGSSLEQGRARRWIPVPWCGRRYLVQRKWMESFCMDVNSGRVQGTETGMALLRVGDDQASAEGLPDVPREFQGLLLAAPVVAEVVDLLGHTKTAEGRPGTEVLLDQGSAEGMRPGIEMRLDVPKASCRLRIVEVREHASVAIVGDTVAAGPQPPSIGWRFSSVVW
jgi:hypothetical protein